MVSLVAVGYDNLFIASKLGYDGVTGVEKSLRETYRALGIPMLNGVNKRVYLALLVHSRWMDEQESRGV